jgi:hypothetical protein
MYFFRIIKTLYPDPETGSGTGTGSLKMLDPDPDSMNLDPQQWQHCCKVYDYQYLTVPANPPRIVIS